MVPSLKPWIIILGLSMVCSTRSLRKMPDSRRSRRGSFFPSFLRRPYAGYLNRCSAWSFAQEQLDSRYDVNGTYASDTGQAASYVLWIAIKAASESVDRWMVGTSPTMTR